MFSGLSATPFIAIGLSAYTVFVSASSAKAVVLTGYDPTGSQLSSTPLQPSVVDSSVSVSPLQQNDPQGWFNSNVWPVPVTSSNYVYFTVSPINQAIRYSSLTYTYRSYFNTGEGATNASIRSSMDNYASIISNFSLTPQATTRSLSFDLSGLAASADPVTFRIFFTGAQGFDWNDLVSTQSGGTGLRLEGELANAAVPEPLTIFGSGMALCWGGWMKRKSLKDRQEKPGI